MSFPLRPQYSGQVVIFLPLIVLFILGCVAFSNVLQYPFVHDDVFLTQTQPQAYGPGWLNAFLKADYAGPNTIINPYYRPILNLFYRAEFQLFGTNPVGYHGVNILFHILNSFLVYFFVVLFNLSHNINNFNSLNVTMACIH